MNVKEGIEALSLTPDEIKQQISEECRKMQVYKSGIEELKEGQTIKNYIFPQLMKSEVTTLEMTGSGFIIKTELATITKTKNIEISWTAKAILLAKNYLNKK